MLKGKGEAARRAALRQLPQERRFCSEIGIGFQNGKSGAGFRFKFP